MAIEHELERMVVRLIGDGSQYKKMLEDAKAATAQAAAEIIKQGQRIEAFKGKLNAAGDSLLNASKNARQSGTLFTTGLTLPLVAMGVAVVKAGADFESGFAGIRKTVDATEAEFVTLRQEFKSLISDIPVNMMDQLKIGELAGQLGIANKNLLPFTETIAKLGVATNLSTEQGATDLARFANITGMSQDKFENLGSAIVALGNSMATTERDIVSMSMRMAGAATTAKMSVPDIMGFSAALSSVGIEAEMGGSAFSRLILEMAMAVSDGGEQLDMFAKVAGQTGEQFKQSFQKDATKAVISLLKGLKALDQSAKVKAVQQMGSEGIRLVDTLLRSSNAVVVFEQALQTSGQAFEENTALSKEAEERFKTFWSQVTKLANNGKLALASAFDAIRGDLDNVLVGIRGVIDWFSKLSQEQKRAIVIIGAVVAAIGPFLVTFALVTAVLGTTVKGVAGLISILQKLTGLGVIKWIIDLHKSVAAMPFSWAKAAQSAQAASAVVVASSTAMTTTITRNATLSAAALGLLRNEMVATSGTMILANKGMIVAGSGMLNLAGPADATAAASKIIDVEFTKTTTKLIGFSGASTLASKAMGSLKYAIAAIGVVLAKALKLLSYFKLELALLGGFVAYKLTRWFADAAFGINEFNKSLKEGTELHGQLLDQMRSRGQMEAVKLGAIADPGKRQAATQSALAQAIKEADGYRASIKGAEERVKGLNTVWRSWTGNRVLEEAQTELKETQERAAEAQARVVALKNALQVDKAMAEGAAIGLSGVGESPDNSGMSRQIMDINQMFQGQAADAFEAAVAAQELAKDVSDLTKSFQEQAATAGMTAGQIEIYKLKMRGATDEQLSAARAANAFNEYQEEQKKLLNRGAEITKQFQSPQEKFAETQKELDTLLGSGAISIETYNRALEDAKKQMGQDYTVDFKANGVDAVLSGSSEALSRIAEFRAGKESPFALDMKPTGSLLNPEAEAGRFIAEHQLIGPGVDDRKEVADKIQKLIEIEERILLKEQVVFKSANL